MGCLSQSNKSHTFCQAVLLQLLMDSGNCEVLLLPWAYRLPNVSSPRILHHPLSHSPNPDHTFANSPFNKLSSIIPLKPVISFLPRHWLDSQVIYPLFLLPCPSSHKQKLDIPILKGYETYKIWKEASASGHSDMYTLLMIQGSSLTIYRDNEERSL